MFDWAGAFGVLGTASVSITMIIMGTLSQRLGRVTSARSYYIGFYLGGLLVGMGAVARIINLNDNISSQSELHESTLWILLYNGGPALGITIGLIMAWRYWSWLLAERS